MSVKVDLDQLAHALADFAFAYLVTVGDDFHAHTVAVDPVFTGGVFDVGPVGRSTRENVARHGDVTLVWPPRAPGGARSFGAWEATSSNADSRRCSPTSCAAVTSRRSR